MRPTHPFRPQWPWVTGDLQTVRNTLWGWVGRGPGAPGDRSVSVELPCDDGTGDRLVAVVDQPVGTNDGARKPLVMLVHGLTGCADSAYMRATAACLLRLGYPVVRLNLRGAGPSRPLCRQQYHAGRGGDLAIAIRALAAGGHGVVRALVGYSLGGSIVLNHLADVGGDTGVAAAAVVSTPLDLAASSQRMMQTRNWLYHAALLRRMKRETLQGGLPEPYRRAGASVRTVYAFDDRVVAPWNGFGTADHYYAQCSAARRLSAVQVPTQLVHAVDDPWIPVATYRAADWAKAPALQPMLVAGGGHVGFHARGDAVSVHDRMIMAWLADRLCNQTA